MTDFYSGRPITVDDLEPGVRLVCAKLLEMGATPYASCDGHGKAAHWYVAFDAPIDVAQAVADRGYFSVTLCQQRAGRTSWRMQMSRGALANGACPIQNSRWWAGE